MFIYLCGTLLAQFRKRALYGNDTAAHQRGWHRELPCASPAQRIPPQTASFRRLTDARRWAARTESDLREGRFFPSTTAKRHTVADLIDRYRKTILPQKRPNTVRPQSTQLRWWEERIGHMRLSDVTPAVIAVHRDALVQIFGAGTVNRYLAALSHAFTMAVKEWEWLDNNPVHNVRRPREPRGRIRFLSDDERHRLLEACKANDKLYLLVVLAISTGARRMELLSLAWPDVDLQRATITLHDTKNRERRALPLTGHALELMRQHAKVRRIDSNLVFPGVDGQKPMHMQLAWERAREQAGIKDFRFHDLRHSAASYLAMSGASLAEIAEVLGHKTLSLSS